MRVGTTFRVLAGALALCTAAVALSAAPLSAQVTQGSPRARAKADSIARAKGLPLPSASDSSNRQALPPNPLRMTLSMQREVFSYSSGGRRDPMISLMQTGDIRPLISELRLIAILYDEEGSNHTAVLENIVDKKTQYRVKVGQMLGRMRVSQITRQEVVFTLNEFGFSRQERLSIRPDTTKARTP